MSAVWKRKQITLSNSHSFSQRKKGKGEKIEKKKDSKSLSFCCQFASDRYKGVK